MTRLTKYKEDPEKHRLRSVQYRKENAEKIKAYTKAKYQRDKEKILESCKRYSQTPSGMASARNRAKKYREQYPEKRAAHNAVNLAIKTKKITRPARCDNCKKQSKPHAHHEDYSKPLNIIWLCRRCHIEHHRAYDAMKEER